MIVLSFPISYYIELTPYCNNRCTGCGNVFTHDGSPDSGDSWSPCLSATEWQIILSKIRPHAFRLSITGGEPTLHPNFAEIVQFVDSIKIPFVIFTNARWQDPDGIIRLLKSLHYFKGFLISLHGATATSHEGFTAVAGSWKETTANIRLAVQAGLSAATSTVLTKHNHVEIPAIVELSACLGVNHAVFNRYIGKRIDDSAVTNAELAQTVQVIENLRQKGDTIKLGNCIPRCFYPSSSSGCLSGVTFCTIDPWGNVRPCNHASLICGNLLEQSIEDIWHGEAMQRWREMIPDQCYSCVEFSKCHGGCRAMALESGSGKDPLIGKPIAEAGMNSSLELVLYEGARPIPRFDSKCEPFGHVLVRGNRVVPVTHQAKPVLDALDGQTTLRDIEECFGAGALSFVASLYRQGLVTLE